ncbi:MAG: HutD family protein [Proteobacteria bacterium]|nr:MAG: HutD family protein [Pseudomonadota bacterium]
MIHHLTTHEYKVMPWKNGGGSTTELAIFPPDSTVQSEFDWRISLADLEGSGPFSSFPGFDRSITQISGEPMTLRHTGRPDKLLARYEPYSFAGELATDCILEGRAQDFNVMTRRGLAATVESVTIETEPLRRVHKSGTTFIWVAFGSVLLHESSKGHDHRLDLHHAFEITGDYESVMTLKPREPDTLVFFVTIAP